MTLCANTVGWSRGGSLVLDGVTVTAEAGETIGLLGPNGSGKSSLLRLLAGLASPDTGTVTLGDADIRGIRRRHVARRVAMVDQHSHTDVDVTVLDVVRLGRIPHRGVFGTDPTDDDAAIERALLDTGMFEKRRRRWHTLSGGERQRTHIARALAQEPEYLLLDEPTNHLDVHHQLSILDLVARLRITTVIALHDLNQAMGCDRVAVMKGGRVIADGSPAEVITIELLSAVFAISARFLTDTTDGARIIRFLSQN